MSSLDAPIERRKLEYYMSVIDVWNGRSVIGVFLFVASLTVILLLRFFRGTKMLQAVQIFFKRVVTVIVVFRYFTKLAAGAITDKRESLCAFIVTDSNSHGEREVLPKLIRVLSRSDEIVFKILICANS